MPGYPVVIVPSGGIPVSYADEGWTIEEAASGLPVTVIPIGGTPVKGVGAASYAPYPAPSGYRWEFLYEGSDQVYEGSEPVIELVVIN